MKMEIQFRYGEVAKCLCPVWNDAFGKNLGLVFVIINYFVIFVFFRGGYYYTCMLFKLFLQCMTGI